MNDKGGYGWNLLLAATALCVAAGNVSAYQVSCNNNSFQVQYLSSVMGEGRPAQVGPATRFHNGVDIPACSNNASVEAIEGGTVVTCAYEGDCFRIETADGHAFDYVHVSREVAFNTQVAAGARIGTVPGSHLHLNEVSTILGAKFKVNPQRAGALDVNDADPAVFVNTTIGGVTGPLIPVKEYPGGEDGTNPSLQVLPQGANGSFVASGKIDFLATARGGGGRKGVYSIGVTVTPAVDPLDLRYSGRFNIRFDSIIDSNPENGARTIYLRRNADSDTHFGTNVKENFSGFQASEALQLDADNETVFPDGEYEACAYIEDYPGSPGTQNDDTCVGLNIAGRCFLVENKKLMFSKSATRNARIPGFRGIRYCETRPRCINTGGLLAGGRAWCRCETQAAKLGLALPANGVTLVFGKSYAGLPLEVS